MNYNMAIELTVETQDSQKKSRPHFQFMSCAPFSRCDSS